MAKKYPFTKDIDGRIYFHLKKKTAQEMALLVLALAYLWRISKRGLLDAIKGNGFKDDNPRKAIRSISHCVENNKNDQSRLLSPGLQKAKEKTRRMDT